QQMALPQTGHLTRAHEPAELTLGDEEAVKSRDRGPCLTEVLREPRVVLPRVEPRLGRWLGAPSVWHSGLLFHVKRARGAREHGLAVPAVVAGIRYPATHC